MCVCIKNCVICIKHCLDSQAEIHISLKPYSYVHVLLSFTSSMNILNGHDAIFVVES